MKTKVAVIGAGGKMGTRVSTNLGRLEERYELMLCEVSPSAQQMIRQRGFDVVPESAAVPQADVVVFAVPDKLIQKLSVGTVSQMKPGAVLIILDPAAAVAKELHMRDDCTFAVAHPCHPSYFLDQDTPEARADKFGGDGGKQDIVMALIAGEQEKFQLAMQVASDMYAPVVHVYEMALREIAFLEPTLVELLGATCLQAMRKTVDEAVRRGISRDAANSFLTGHIYNLTANFLGYLPNTAVSAACQVAMDIGDRLVLREDWTQIWQDDVLDRVIATMLHPESPKI